VEDGEVASRLESGVVGAFDCLHVSLVNWGCHCRVVAAYPTT
jgi:hypothetical protein